MEENKKTGLPAKLIHQVCSVILDTGFVGNPDEYVKQYYGKQAVADLTTCEAEMIVRMLKPGCLYEGDPKDLEPEPIPEEADEFAPHEEELE